MARYFFDKAGAMRKRFHISVYHMRACKILDNDRERMLRTSVITTLRLPTQCSSFIIPRFSYKSLALELRSGEVLIEN